MLAGEITGSEATLSLPDPNDFDGDLLLWRPGAEEPEIIPATGPANGRGLGVLDTMVSITESVETGAFVDVVSSAPASAALPEDWGPTAATL